jgi:protein involved in polysaccharide export with SLBB domain
MAAPISTLLTRCALVVALALTVAGCESTAPLGASVPDASVSAAAATAAAVNPPVPEFRVGAGDKLKVNVFGEQTLTGEYVVDPSGSLAMPLAGSIPVAGATVREVENRIAAKLRGSFIKNPKVAVEIASFRPFYVIGEVTKPGEYPYRAGLNLLSAVAVAGGYTYRANTNRVMITRAGSAQEVAMDTRAGPIVINPGDVVRITERFF